MEARLQETLRDATALELGSEGWKPSWRLVVFDIPAILENPYRRRAILRDLEELYMA